MSRVDMKHVCIHVYLGSDNHVCHIANCNDVCRRKAVIIKGKKKNHHHWDSITSLTTVLVVNHICMIWLWMISMCMHLRISFFSSFINQTTSSYLSFLQEQIEFCFLLEIFLCSNISKYSIENYIPWK